MLDVSAAFPSIITPMAPPTVIFSIVSLSLVGATPPGDDTTTIPSVVAAKLLIMLAATAVAEVVELGGVVDRPTSRALVIYTATRSPFLPIELKLGLTSGRGGAVLGALDTVLEAFGT